MAIDDVNCSIPARFGPQRGRWPLHLLVPGALAAAVAAGAFGATWTPEAAWKDWLTAGPEAEVTALATHPPAFVVFAATSAHDLARVLDAAWGHAELEGAVPNLAPGRLPHDLDDLEQADRKRTFFRSVLPHVLAANRQARGHRAELKTVAGSLATGAALPEEDRALLGDLAARYRVKMPPEELDPQGIAAVVDELLARVDVVPPSLALAQAALESGWGRSRLARLANNLFGQHLFRAGHGFGAPANPDDGFGFAEFGSLAEATGAYLYNLNTFWAYEAFRAARRTMRVEGAELDAHRLAAELELYSERGEAYVRDVRSMIRGNRLTLFDGARLSRLPRETWTEPL